MSDLSEDKYARCFTFKSNNICVGTKDGVQLFDYIKPTELILTESNSQLKTHLVELVPEENLLIYVPDNERNTLRFYNHQRREELTDKGPLQYETRIIRIKAIKERILVATEKTMHIYGIYEDEFTKLRVIELSGTLTENIVDLSTHPIKSFVAYPNFDRIGYLFVADCVDPISPRKNLPIVKQEPPKTFPAHDNAIVAIAIDPYGRTVASASQTGVLIKVHRIFNGECIYEFRRGLTLGITITSLTFSPDSRFVFSQDTSQYLKVYKFGYELSVATKGTHWFLEKLQRLAEAVLPEDASNWFFQAESFASVQLPDSSVCKVTSTVYKNDSKNIPPHLIIGNDDGLVYTYLVDIVHGGPCTFLNCYSIRETKDIEKPDNTWVML